MPYTAEIGRSTPGAILILLDQSASMSADFGGASGKAKAPEAANATNRLIQELVLKCAREDGIRDYFYLGVIGYGTGVSNALGYVTGSGWLNPLSLIGENPLRIETRSRNVSDGVGGLVKEEVEFPIWVESRDDGRSTPMCDALDHAKAVLESWLVDFPASFPPIVLNITDGEATDGDPVVAARSLQSVAVDDGEVLLYNCHLSSNRSASQKYISEDSTLPDRYARQLFAMSSELPPIHLEGVIHYGYPGTSGSRGFVFNAELTDLPEFFDIGTRVNRIGAR